MIYELKDTKKVQKLFDGWEETLIYSCMEQVMGKIYVTDMEMPRSAYAYVGCFAFYAGEPDEELMRSKPSGFTIMVPQNEGWAWLIEKCFPEAKRITRYAIKKGTEFDLQKLQKFAKQLPPEYELKNIDSDIYEQCLKSHQMADFVAAFGDREKYLTYGRGMVILKKGRIVSGASSYTRYKNGIEIEVDAIEEERRKHLATVACAALILRCLEENLYPSWDAQNMNSVHLAEKLGYEYSHEYLAYEVKEREA